MSANTSTSSPKQTSTLRSILTGDVHKHNPMFALERSVDQRISHPQAQQQQGAASSQNYSQSTLKQKLWPGKDRKYQHLDDTRTESKVRLVG